MPPSADEDPGLGLAVTAEVLFLANLLVAPGIAFLALIWMRHRYPDVSALARCHIDQAFFASLWSGMLLVVATGALLALGGLAWKWTWVTVVLYFTCIHSTLILFGVVGLAKAQAGRTYTYPLLGPRGGRGG